MLRFINNSRIGLRFRLRKTVVLNLNLSLQEVI